VPTSRSWSHAAIAGDARWRRSLGGPVALQGAWSEGQNHDLLATPALCPCALLPSSALVESAPFRYSKNSDMSDDIGPEPIAVDCPKPPAIAAHRPTTAHSMPILQNDHIRVEIVTRGAELFRLQDCRGTDFLWDGDPTWWSGHAPFLFPIVGKAPRDTVVVDGREYPMRQHGFARTSEFAVMRADETVCCLRLEASIETLAQYPFNFVLDIRYAIGGPSLLTEAIVRNVNDRAMPVSFGFHPALKWPLTDAGPRDGHMLVFGDREPAPVRRLQDGLSGRDRHPSPVVDGRLELNDSLFVDGRSSSIGSPRDASTILLRRGGR
jgi:galactose mutarotase-like enzyme